MYTKWQDYHSRETSEMDSIINPRELTLLFLDSPFMRRLRIKVVFLIVVLTLITGCGQSPEIRTINPKPTPVLPSSPNQELINLVYPLPSSELIGGQRLRVTLTITDSNGTGVEGANTQVEIWSPEDVLNSTIEPKDQGGGRYLTDPTNLPMRNASGIWTIQASAELEDEQTLQTTGTFKARPSFSEGLKENFGFWLDLSSPLFAYTGPPFAVPELKFHPYEDKGGYVILTNANASRSLAIIDIHWRPDSYPPDQKTALAYVGQLAGPHAMTVQYSNLEAGEIRFLDAPAWQITGQWEEPQTAGINQPKANNYPVSWIIFPCPDSEYTWTLLITSRDPGNMPDLRSILDTFQCPDSD